MTPPSCQLQLQPRNGTWDVDTGVCTCLLVGFAGSTAEHQTLTLHGCEESAEATDASAPSAPQEEKAIPEGRFETVRLSRWPDHLSLFEGTTAHFSLMMQTSQM